MKAVILAAGQGTRIRSVHGERPKCLIEVDDRTILDHQLEALSMTGIRDIAIVVGYKKEQIIAHIKARVPKLAAKIQFIENPAFAVTNNIYSLWLAREWVGGDSFLCSNADVAFHSDILLDAVRSKAPIAMIVDREWRDETMKVVIRNGRIVRMNKKITRSEFSGTYIGITVFSKSVQSHFFQKVHRLVFSGAVNTFFNSAVQELADEGVRVGYTLTHGLPWAEIDDPADLAYASECVFPRLHDAVAA